jgi:UDP-2-acetamido-3-amino-2,3-dideoxy-glucuronate N-acetyltransferase
MTNTIPSQKSLLLVGGGNWGKNLVRNFHALNVLHTICDTNEDLLKTYATTYPDIITTSNFTAALQHPAIDKVAIAAPAALHYTLAAQALKAGKDVFVEKPLCLDSSEAEDLLALAKQQKSILMVGHLLQYHPHIQHLQELVASKKLGELQYIVSNRLNLGQIRTEENVLWSFSPHDISVILSLCGDQLPSQVRCIGESYLSKNVADLSILTMHLKKNLRAHIHVSWLHPFKEQKLIVIGSSGMAVFDDLKPWQEKLAFYQQPIIWKDGNIPKIDKCQPQFLDVPQSEPLQNECSHFLRCCETRQKPKTDGDEGLRVLKVLQAAQSSLSNNGEAMHINTSHSSYFSHPTAIIDPGADIGAGTKIWHFSHIMDTAKIGAQCNIGQNVVISPGAILGCNVKVQNNVSVYTGVICEDNVFLGPSVVFTNVINPRSEINRRNNYQTTLVKQGATIGANATIICGIELGEYCFIGAGAVVTKNVKPYALMVGNPARQIGWVSRHGERLDLPLNIFEEDRKIAICPSSGESYILHGDRVETLTFGALKLCPQLPTNL